MKYFNDRHHKIVSLVSRLGAIFATPRIAKFLIPALTMIGIGKPCLVLGKIESAEDSRLQIVDADRSPNQWPDPRPQDVSLTRLQEAKLLLRQLKWEEAVVPLKFVIKHNPQHFYANIHLAQALTFLNRRDEGLSLLYKIYNHQRDKDQARAQIIKRRIDRVGRVFLNKDTYQLFQNGMNFLSSGQIQKAIDQFSQARSKEENNTEVMLRLAHGYIRSEEYDEAKKHLDRAIELNRFNDLIRLWRGYVLLNHGEKQAALNDLKYAYSESPQLEYAPVWLAEAYLINGETRKAIELLKRDVEREPFHLLSLQKLAKIESDPRWADADSLWRARKTLQLASSRLSEYQEQYFSIFENPVKMLLHRPEQIRETVQTQINRIDDQIASITGPQRVIKEPNPIEGSSQQ